VDIILTIKIFKAFKTYLTIKGRFSGLKIRFSKDGVKYIEIDTISVEDILKKLVINPVEVVVTRNGSVLLEDEILTNNDNIKIIKVIHGG
jgi:sulfur carrier protein